jgi:hypothetical protein
MLVNVHLAISTSSTTEHNEEKGPIVPIRHIHSGIITNNQEIRRYNVMRLRRLNDQLNIDLKWQRKIVPVQRDYEIHWTQV